MADQPTPNIQSIYRNPDEIAAKVDKVLVSGLANQFPIETRNYRLEASDIRAEPKKFSHLDEKDAILKSKSLTYPVKATLTLYDKQTGKQLDQVHDFSLMDSFYLTGKHTMLYKGNNYGISNQLQLMPGVYTRSRDTGELESHVNTGKGRSFSIVLEPESGIFKITPASTSAAIPLAPIMTSVFGVGASEAEKYIPKAVWDANLKASAGKEAAILHRFYSAMVNKSLQQANPSMPEMAMQLRESLETSTLSTQTTKITLGKALPNITGETLLLTMRNLVDTHSGKRVEDNRDSLQFKKVQNLPDYLQRRFDKNPIVRTLKSKIGYNLERVDKTAPKIRSVIPSKPFNKFFSDYITKSSLLSTPTETNPLESIENVGKVTVLGAGEGGIGSIEGVPMAARNVDPSHLGIIDPSRTPESDHAGIDQRFTLTAGRDDEGNLYAKVRDNAGNMKYLSVADMMTKAIGFPNQPHKGVVTAQVNGKIAHVDASKIDYWLNDATDMYTITTNMIPFLNSNHPGRLTMASKALTQALSLVNREAPLVQTVNGKGVPYVKLANDIISTRTDEAGVVTKLTPTQTFIKREDGTIKKVDNVKNLPYNMKGFLDDETPLVKVGDTVKPFDRLYENNYTKDGVLSLGKNLNVAYMPYKGYNHEDGLVISQSCASGLDSHHAYRIDYSVTDTSVMRRALINRYFPGKYTRAQLNKLDDKGFAKVGETLNHGDPVYVVLEKREPSPEDRMLGRLHKSLINPYRAVTEDWDHVEDGQVVDAHTEGKEIRILVRSVKALEVGDKLTGLHGNKGIVSKILPDNEMPYSKETGKPVDILLNPASVTSRINLGQLMEVAAAKIAKKTGKPYLIHNFSKSSNVQELKDELTKNGLSDTEELVDPLTNKSLGNILTGPQYFLKLFKTTDQNWSARNVGAYDGNLQPSKGGEEGSKSVGYMEMLGLMGSNARKNLKEIATLKSEKNEDYWSKFQMGLPLPKPRMTFATSKFFDYLKGSGIQTGIHDGKVTISPLTNHDVLSMSNGEIQNPKLLVAKNLEPEKGGLFDSSVTGGLEGTKWAHYKLAEPIANPSFERPIRTLLGLTKNEFTDIAHGNTVVKKKGTGIYNLHDLKSGKLIKTVNLTSGEIPDDIHEPDDEDEDDSTLLGNYGNAEGETLPGVNSEESSENNGEVESVQP